MRTITQAAAELNVSRKTVYNKIESLSLKTSKQGKNNFLNEENFERMKQDIIIHKGNESNVRDRINDVIARDRDMLSNGITDREYTDFKERVKFLEEQIVAKDSQLFTKDAEIKGLIQAQINLTNVVKMLNPSSSGNEENEEAVTVLENKKSFFKRFMEIFK